ncbi:Uncharacterised protein [Vibrio cholerae]|nr:Uncharacterised protein [Vibrio cholerae]
MGRPSSVALRSPPAIANCASLRKRNSAGPSVISKVAQLTGLASKWLAQL